MCVCREWLPNNKPVQAFAETHQAIARQLFPNFEPEVPAQADGEFAAESVSDQGNDQEEDPSEGEQSEEDLVPTLPSISKASKKIFIEMRHSDTTTRVAYVLMTSSLFFLRTPCCRILQGRT